MRGNVYLIGYMCSGKSTLGTALAAKLGMPFLDLDSYIEEREGLRIADIFKAKGEDAFRHVEALTLKELAGDAAPKVVACGGGTPCFLGNMDVMRASGITVHLRPCKERLLQRLMEGRAKRPLLAAINSEEEMWLLASSMLEKRQPFYSQAHITFDSSLLETGTEITESATALAALLTAYANH